MLVPGLRFSASGRIIIELGLDAIPAFYNQGVGFQADGSLLLDLEVPTGDHYRAGIRQSPRGVFYTTIIPSAEDTYIQGIRISPLGQIVHGLLDPLFYFNGNPFAVDNLLSVTE